jgi:transcriptional regulator with XRE-family HTH domain
MPAYKKPEKAFLKVVGDNIRHYRQQAGFTLEQLGEDIGLDKSNLHRIEQGKNITLLTLLKIAVFLDKDPRTLLNTNISVT